MTFWEFADKHPWMAICIVYLVGEALVRCVFYAVKR